MFRKTIHEIMAESRFSPHIRVLDHIHLDDQRGRLYEANESEKVGAGKGDAKKGGGQCKNSRCRDFALRVYDISYSMERVGGVPNNGIPAHVLNQSRGLELNHPNLLTFYDMDIVFAHAHDMAQQKCRDVITKECENAYVLILMELASGNLAHWMTVNARRERSKDIVRIAFNILCGLEYLHSQNLVYTRLHPKNILMVETKAKGEQDPMVAKLGDFQDVVDLNSLNVDDDDKLSQYTSPEILLNSRTYDSSSDMWSFGIILFEMLMGNDRTPFLDAKYDSRMSSSRKFVLSSIFQWLGTPSVEWRKKYLQHTDMEQDAYPPAEFLERLSEFFPECDAKKNHMLLDLIERCLQLDPEKRITAKQALHHKIFKGFVPPKYKVPRLQKQGTCSVPKEIVVSLNRDVEQGIVPKKQALLSLIILNKYLNVILKQDEKTKNETPDVYLAHCASYLIAQKLVSGETDSDAITSIKGQVCGASEANRVNILFMERLICKLLKFRFL